MIVGHTKFSPDSVFGKTKGLLREVECKSILDLIGTEGLIQKSAINNKIVTYKDPISKMNSFNWRDWKKFFKKNIFPEKSHSEKSQSSKTRLLKASPRRLSLLEANFLRVQLLHSRRLTFAGGKLPKGKTWWAEADLNCRPHAYQACTLTS